MSYFSALKTEPGLNKPEGNPCSLLDFGLVSLAAGEDRAAKRDAP